MWRDTSSIRGGSVWDSEIETALRNSDSVLLVASASSIASTNVADEIGYARTIGKPIVPLTIEDVTLPFRIHRAQAIDFREDFNSAIVRLLDALAPNSSSTPPPRPPKQDKPETHASRATNKVRKVWSDVFMR